MNFLKLTPRVGKGYNPAGRKKPHNKSEYAAHHATALPVDSPLAVGWDGLLKLPGGKLAINDNPQSRQNARRLGFAVKGEGDAA